MGSPEGEEGRDPSDEGPQHEVTISRPFYMGVTEVTQEQYEAVMGNNPGKFKDPQNPVECVCWNDAVEFCRRVSLKTGKSVRLPTEAEWEYACRAGSRSRFCFGDSDASLAAYAWYKDNGGETTHAVGRGRPNTRGLYDMHGNVCEWCSDWYEKNTYTDAAVVDPQGPSSGTHRAMRGGAFDWDAAKCRSAYRQCDLPEKTYSNVGFRVVVEAK
jgi:formylglycine-generating enzyme required for sulfatase activity